MLPYSPDFQEITILFCLILYGIFQQLEKKDIDSKKKKIWTRKEKIQKQNEKEKNKERKIEIWIEEKREMK